MKYVLAPLAITVSLISGWFVYQNSLEQMEQPGAAKKAEVISVHTTPVRKQTVDEQIELVGSLEANSIVEISSRVRGYIRRLNYDLGDRVEKGTAVIELDDSESQERVRHAEAALEVAKAQVRAQERRKELAQGEVKRLMELSKNGFTTEQQRQQAHAELAIATAELELEQARVTQAESDLQSSRLTLNETRIVAPISGYIANRSVNIGDLATPDIPLLSIVDLDVVRTVVHVVEKDYQKIEIGQSADLQVDTFPQRTFHGTVTRKAPTLDPETRTAAVQIEIQNPQALLKPGMHARVSILSGQPRETHVVPVAALVERGDRPAIFVVTGTPPRIHRRDVQTGVRDGDAIEILSEIVPGDQVVTLGSRIVQHGQEVRPIEIPWPETLQEPTLPIATETAMGTAE